MSRYWQDAKPRQPDSMVPRTDGDTRQADQDSAGEDSFPDTLGIDEVGDRGRCYGDQEYGAMLGGPVSVAT